MVAVVVAIIGVSFLCFFYFQKKQQLNANLLAKTLLEQAENKAKLALDAARLEAKQLIFAAEQKAHQILAICTKNQQLLESKEDLFSKEKNKILQKQHELEKKEKAFDLREKELQQALERYNALCMLTAEDARKEVLARAEKEAEKECQMLFFQKRSEIELRLENHVHSLVATALARLPHKALTDATTCEIVLPNEEMKAKIIGREGKNIKAFQQLTGVTLVIDENKEALVLSCFDLQRREIAKIAIQELIKDGRISLSRIEEEVEAASANLDATLIRYGQEAIAQLHLHSLHPTLLIHLGRLKLRTSFGQNLLDHSIEVASIMGQIAAELKLNISTAIRMGLLHDIGKAITMDTPRSHALAGYDLCLECGESQEVANGVGCHHDEMPALSLEAKLVKCADYLSGARKGARLEHSDTFFKRLRDFETEALTFEGVRSAFALAAGRELQVFVRPDIVSDADALFLAKQIAKKIQPLASTLRVQVTVIRETKSVEYSF